MVPKFTIIVPVFNLGTYIFDCLASIRKQTFTKFEVLIVDDGSSDNTSIIAQQFSKSDSRFKYFFKINGGVSSARNFGLQYARGEYIWFVDGDDYIHPDSLNYLYNLFYEYPQADYISFDYDWTKDRYDESFSSIESNTNFTPQIYFCTTRLGFGNALRASPIAVCCVCYKHSLIREHKFCDIRIAEDRLFALDMCFKANIVITTRVKLYGYYQRTDSATRQITPEFVADLFTFSETLFKFRDLKSDWAFSHLHFLFSVEMFPSIMKHLLRLHKYSDRRLAFDRLLVLMEKVFTSFPKEWEPKYIKWIRLRKSYFLAWLFLDLRYKPRHYIAKHPYLLYFYQQLKG